MRQLNDRVLKQPVRRMGMRKMPDDRLASPILRSQRDHNIRIQQDVAAALLFDHRAQVSLSHAQRLWCRKQRDHKRPRRLPHLQPAAVSVRGSRGTSEHQCNDQAFHMPPIIMPRICIGWSSNQKPKP